MSELYSSCVAAQAKLENTIERFQLRGGKIQMAKVDMRQTHRLDQVQDILKEAADVLVAADQAYADATSKDFWGRIREGFRRFSTKAQDAECFVGLIPEGDTYLSVLTGGLKLICKVSTRL